MIDNITMKPSLQLLTIQEPKATLHCKYCGERIEQRHYGRRRQFCSMTCRKRFGSKRWVGLKRKCDRCGKLYRPIPFQRRYCKPCRRYNVARTRYYAKSRVGLSETYLIGDMTPAEYAFSRIMDDQGTRLDFIGRNGTRFELNGTHYRPDFFDQQSQTYYEVSGTRQAYHANKGKIRAFRKAYPHITLLVVKPDGTRIGP
jgi:hypothetical protein